MKPPVEALESWYRKFRRPLPWRKSRDPYRIWISEVMLQQTTVTAVIPYYEKFLNRFPTVDHLARAKQETVLSLWAGLGYYSRARNLHKGAKYISLELKGKFPKSSEELRKIPGIGPYTAGAISSIAFNKPSPIVDGNVQRVFARYYFIDEPLEKSSTQKLFWKHAEEWVSVCDSPHHFNQSLMELGATVCTKANPSCDACVIRKGCIARKEDSVDTVPRKKKRRAPVDLYWMGLVLEHDDEIFLVKNKEGEWWRDMWDLPRIELKDEEEAPKTISKWMKKLPVESHRPLAKRRHTVTHHRIHFFPQLFRLSKRTDSRTWNGQWFPKKRLSGLPVSSLVKKVWS